MTVSSPAGVDAYKVAGTKPDNCWKPAVWRSVGAADRWLTGINVIKGRGRENQCLDRAAVIGGAAAPL